MRQFDGQKSRMPIIGCATLLLVACGGGSGGTNEANVTEVDSNVMLQQIGNDASALEAAGNAVPIGSTNERIDAGGSASEPASGSSSNPVLGETSGGNTLQGNVSGM